MKEHVLDLLWKERLIVPLRQNGKMLLAGSWKAVRSVISCWIHGDRNITISCVDLQKPIMIYDIC